jgi:homoserine O-acetyltransferase
MDLYDVAAGYESEEEALSRIEAEVLFIGISSDWLFPAHEVRATARTVGARYAHIDSLSGHDSFLKDWAQLREAIGPFLDSKEAR